MKTALISDIHGNFEALQTVLADIREQQISRIFCLGDIVGYGPNPRECLDEVIRKCDITILGNHDEATLFDPDGFNPVALQAVYWTRDQLEQAGGNATQAHKRWDFLGELPRQHTEDNLLFVHGSAREPTNEYVFPEDVYKRPKLEAIFSRVTQYCFQGHTHIPGVFTHDFDFITPDECDYEYQLGSEKALINVGSVGQPRDEDPRSCYTIFDSETNLLQFRRLSYANDETARKIYSIEQLHDSLGNRLKAGR
ncbi:MAG: metallophosphatase family protein [Pirellulaceae bacterium]|nr:metallophosphatase family protein [Pirellulaceae bacterium]